MASKNSIRLAWELSTILEGNKYSLVEGASNEEYNPLMGVNSEMISGIRGQDRHPTAERIVNAWGGIGTRMHAQACS